MITYVKQNLILVGRGATVIEKKSCTENVYIKKTDGHIRTTTHVVLSVKLYYTWRVKVKTYDRTFSFKNSNHYEPLNPLLILRCKLSNFIMFKNKKCLRKLIIYAPIKN